MLKLSPFKSFQVESWNNVIKDEIHICNQLVYWCNLEWQNIKFAVASPFTFTNEVTEAQNGVAYLMLHRQLATNLGLESTSSASLLAIWSLFPSSFHGD